MDPVEITDLIRSCVKGDDAARARFIANYSELIRKTVIYKLRTTGQGAEMANEIDDICHEVVATLFKNNCDALGRIKKTRSIDAWLMTVAQNHVYSYLRKRGAQLRSEEFMVRDEVARYVSSPEDQAVDRERRSIVLEALGRLDPKDRLALQLYYLENLKYAEIAELLGLNINTVATRLMRAKARLRRRVEGEGK